MPAHHVAAGLFHDLVLSEPVVGCVTPLDSGTEEDVAVILG
jgi:hypothetical protein